MKRKIIIRLFSAFLLILTTIAKGQADPPETSVPGLKKNALIGSLGISPITLLSNYWNYERLILNAPKLTFNTYWIRAGGGIWVNMEGAGPLYEAGLATLTGLKNDHLEFYFGCLFVYDRQWYEHVYADYEYERDSEFGNNSMTEPDKSDYQWFRPVVNLGYRYQKPGEHLVFRIGSGYPNVFYISLGYCF